MAENSGIEWTHHTFNPWIGCTKVSPACDHCYAEHWDKRFKGERWGAKADRTRTKTWSKPFRWDKLAREAGERHRVFCASLADVFDNHKSIEPKWREALWYTITNTPNLDWLLLTKRPQNIKRYLPDDWGGGYPNVWLGTTVENQDEAERRIPHLLNVPAALHFVSCEPLLGPLELRCIAGMTEDEDGRFSCWWDAMTCIAYDDGGEEISCNHDLPNQIGWVIAGGESGRDFRPVDPNWFRSLRDQCDDAGVPFLFKQWDGKNQREIKAMGRELDGVVHDGYPMTPLTHVQERIE